ncbi:MAG TPA: hypothetical protein VF407_11910 [Polyangiaceae bacterium]
MTRTRCIAAASIVAAAVIAACNTVHYPPGWHDHCSSPDPKKLPPRVDFGDSNGYSQWRSPGFPELQDADAAKEFFAGAKPPSYGGGMVYEEDDGGTQTSVDAFVAATDFAKEKLVVIGDSVQGQLSLLGATVYPDETTVVFHPCASSGGAAPPTARMLSTYRVPKTVKLDMDECGPCPQVACCPP